MADVFISYHQSDGASALVRRISKELENKGVSCWYDSKKRIEGHLNEEIANEINSCKVFLLIWDEGSDKSPWCYKETSYAEKCNKTLIPFRLGEFDALPRMDILLHDIVKINGGNSPEVAYMQELFSAICDIFGKELLQKPELSSKVIKIGSCGDSTYTLDGCGSLIIFGNEIQNYQWDRKSNIVDTPWWDEREIISFVSIQNGISVIGSNAFRDCSNLAKVTIPPSVTSFGDAVFFRCTSLVSAEIPKSVGYIGDYAFSDCRNLSVIDIPDGVEYVGYGAFQRCKKLIDITIPQSVTYIGEYAFSYCENLNPVIIPHRVKYIGNSAFRGCTSLTNIFIPDSVKVIESFAFEGCEKLHSASIPANAKYRDMWSGFPSFPYNTRITRRE